MVAATYQAGTCRNRAIPNIWVLQLTHWALLKSSTLAQCFTLHQFSHLILIITYELGTILIPMLKMRKLRLAEVLALPQGLTAGKCQDQAWLQAAHPVFSRLPYKTRLFIASFLWSDNLSQSLRAFCPACALVCTGRGL